MLLKNESSFAANFIQIQMTFEELGLHDQLLEALSYMGFEQATPIQEQAIPAILQGRDLIACAQTGTGKTGSFYHSFVTAFIRAP